MALRLAEPRGAEDLLDATSLTRTETVWPGMCGHNSLLLGQIGDWTWDAVSKICGTEVLRARTAAGQPTYLSFYYYRVRGSARFHVRTPTFGDRLHVMTRLYDCGRESVLALHRITRSPADEAEPFPEPETPFSADEFYGASDGGTLYVENFNRWISRPEKGSNRELVRSSPVDFRHAHLPVLPPEHSPRVACHRARTEWTFRDAAVPYVELGPGVHDEYPVDITRDLNGVGMLYFASYFSIVDRALLGWWRRMGRSDREFLDRIVVDQQLCYLGNADADCVVSTSVQAWHEIGKAGLETIDVVLRDRDGDRLLAVCSLQVVAPPGLKPSPTATAG